MRWWNGRKAALSGHALAETYPVLTRLPGDIRLAPGDAARLLAERFTPPLLMDAKAAARLPAILSELGVAGSAVLHACRRAGCRGQLLGGLREPEDGVEQAGETLLELSAA